MNKLLLYGLWLAVIFVALTNLVQSSRLKLLENRVEQLESVNVQNNRPSQPTPNSKKN